jgi:hypothetical protein
VQVEKEWCDAAIHRDAKRLDRIFADDISWLEDVGYRNKAEVMRRYMVEIQENMWGVEGRSHTRNRQRWCSLVSHSRKENEWG